MSGVLDMFWLVLLLVAILAVIAAVGYRMRSKRGRESEAAEPRSAVAGGSRLTVVESAAIDETRRLVLLRCDDAEHLIVVGGAVDLVVEHDVGRSRATRAPAKVPMAEPAVRRLSAPQINTESSEPVPRTPAGAMQTGDAVEPQKTPAVEHPERAARPTLTAVPAPAKEGRAPAPPVRPETAGREGPRAPLVAAPQPPEQKAAPVRPPNGPARGAEPKPALPVKPAAVQAAPVRSGPSQSPAVQSSPEKPRPRAVEGLPTREEPAPLARPASPAPLAASRSEAPPQRVVAPVQNNQAGRGAPETIGPSAAPREAARHAPPAAPDATWPEADGIEGEIGRALRIQADAAPADDRGHSAPVPRTAVEQRGAAAPAPTNPATTLGDLAERLEEALAREVKAANQNRGHLDLDLDGFGFDEEAQGTSPAAEQRQAAPEPAREAQKRVEPQSAAPRAIAPAPEPERREIRQPIERQEEAPVISLQARRREAADPLEDEMARLLGELTGDSNRR